MGTTSVAILMGAAVHLFAGVGCEDTFKKSGTPITGTRYSAVVAVESLSVADAIGQLHGIAIKKKLDILSGDAANGNMLLEDRAGFRHKAIPYVISVTDAVRPPACR